MNSEKGESVTVPGRLATVLASALLLLAAAPVPAAGPAEPSVDIAAQRFDLLVTGYLLDYYAAHPVRATRLGIHDHDGRLPDLSRRAIRLRIEDLEGWLTQLQSIDRASLGGDAYFDHRILEYAIRAELLELREVRGWTRNPMHYNKLMADGLASLVDRRFAPLEVRLHSAIQRLGQFGQLIDAARANLEQVPQLWAEIGLRNTRGTLEFLQAGVQRALQEQGLERLERKLIQRWERARRRAANRLAGYVKWLEEELLPEAGGDFRLGRDLLERKLRYEEHLPLTVSELSVMNERAIRDYRERLAFTAKKIDPQRLPGEVMRAIAADHPSAERLIETAREYVETARDLVRERQLLTLPTAALPVVRATPPYARSGFASMSAPGPFEAGDAEAYYNLTNVDPSWPRERQEQHLTYFNYPGLMGVSVHEVMPGHFVQLWLARELPTDLRRVFAPQCLVEGWAHYAEEMMVDEGLGDGRPEVRMAQLRRALQRHARWSVSLSLHALGGTLPDAARSFGEIAYFAPFPALRETQRATYDPTYLCYALGRMQILALREAYKSYRLTRGEPFTLREFHDRLLRLGLPLSMARQALMPEWAQGADPTRAPRHEPTGAPAQSSATAESESRR
jgi:uncharacterized protein (DUF885 family)